MAPSKRNQIAGNGEPIFFHGEKERPHGVFSQWHKGKFTDPNYPDVTFNCAEQYMMFGKAQLFGDSDITANILTVTSSKAQKDLGKKTKGFSDALWDPAKLGIVKRGNYLKFSQNEKFKKVLLETGDRDLVEASPKDSIWGIGYSTAGAKKVSSDKWGQNLLGIALMHARRKIRAEEIGDDQDEEEGEEDQPDTVDESIEQDADEEEVKDRSESPPATKKPSIATKKRKRSSVITEEIEEYPKPKKTASVASKKKLVKKAKSSPLTETPKADDEDTDNVNKGLNQVLNMAKGLRAQPSNDDQGKEENPALKKKAQKKADDDLLEMLTKKAMEDSMINGSG